MLVFSNDIELEPRAHREALSNVLSAIQNHASAWPFLKPVGRTEVPDYYDVIKYPMGMLVVVLFHQLHRHNNKVCVEQTIWVRSFS